jgi:TolA-binding protein
MAQKSEPGGQDLFSKLQAQGEDMIGRINDLNINIPGGQKLVETANQLKERLDEVQRRLRGLDVLERRVDALEKKVDELSRSASGAKATTKRTAQTKPKPKASS